MYLVRQAVLQALAILFSNPIFKVLIFNQLQFDDEGPVSAPKRTSTQSQVVNEVLFGF